MYLRRLRICDGVVVWLDPGTQECNGSSLQASAPFESNFPRKYRRICLVITHTVILKLFPVSSHKQNPPLQ